MKDRGETYRSTRGWPGLGLVAWVTVLLAVALGTGAAARGPLAPPPLTDPGSWLAWAGARTPVEAAFAVLAMIVVVLAWYLLAVTVLLVAARLWGARRLMSVAELLTLPVVRRSIHAAIGLGLTSSAITGAGSAGARLGGPAELALGPAAAVLIGTGGVEAADPEGQAGDPPGPPGSGGGNVAHSATFPPPEGPPPVMRRLPDGPAAPATEVAASVTEWEVRPGDHLWSVAARTLASAWGTAVSDDEVTPYWLAVVEANRDRLVDPANTDLIVTGQVLALPATPAPSR